MSDKKPIEFLPLLPDDVIERMATRKAAPPAPRPEPFPIVAAAYPRVAERIRGLWGTPQCDVYLDELLIDRRGGRQGFPPDVVSALLMLSEDHQARFGFRKDEAKWNDINKRGGL
jgi:hypothetical protein